MHRVEKCPAYKLFQCVRVIGILMIVNDRTLDQKDGGHCPTCPAAQKLVLTTGDRGAPFFCACCIMVHHGCCASIPHNPIPSTRKGGVA